MSLIEDAKKRFDEFVNEYAIAYNFSNQNWIIINELITEVYKNLDDKDFVSSVSDINDYITDIIIKIKRIPTLHVKSEKSEGYEKFISTIKKVLNGVKSKFDFIKPALYIPFYSVVSLVLAKIAFLLTATLIYAIFPDETSEEMIVSVLTAVIFVIINVVVFVDKLFNDWEFDHKDFLIKYIISIPIWGLLILTIINVEYDGQFNDFMYKKYSHYIDATNEFGDSTKIPVYVMDYRYIILYLYLGHFWLSIFTGELLISGIICYIINISLVLLIWSVYVKRYNKELKIINAYKKTEEL